MQDVADCDLLSGERSYRAKNESERPVIHGKKRMGLGGQGSTRREGLVQQPEKPSMRRAPKPAEALGATPERYVKPEGSVSAAPRAPTTKMKTPSIIIDPSARTDRSLNLNYFRRRGPDLDYTARGRRLT